MEDHMSRERLATLQREMKDLIENRNKLGDFDANAAAIRTIAITLAAVIEHVLLEDRM
jgi:hypothetical protein